jgi:hypothetical protein
VTNNNLKRSYLTSISIKIVRKELIPNRTIRNFNYIKSLKLNICKMLLKSISRICIDYVTMLLKKDNLNKNGFRMTFKEVIWPINYLLKEWYKHIKIIKKLSKDMTKISSNCRMRSSSSSNSNFLVLKMLIKELKIYKLSKTIRFNSLIQSYLNYQGI